MRGCQVEKNRFHDIFNEIIIYIHILYVSYIIYCFYLGIQNKILISITGYDRVTRNTITANIILKDGTKTPITLSPDNGSGAFEATLIPPTSEYKIQVQGNHLNILIF